MLFVPLTTPFGKTCSNHPVLQYRTNSPQLDGYAYFLFRCTLSLLNFTTLCDDTDFLGRTCLACMLLSRRALTNPIELPLKRAEFSASNVTLVSAIPVSWNVVTIQAQICNVEYYILDTVFELRFCRKNISCS